MPGVPGRGQGWTEASRGDTDVPDDRPDQLAMTDLSDGFDGSPGGNNLLRPTTTTIATSTTTEPSTTSTIGDGADGGATSSDSGSGTHSGSVDGSVTTDPAAVGTSSTDLDPTPGRWEEVDLAIVYDEDFVAGEVAIDDWRAANGPSPDGWGLNRPSSIQVVADQTASGGHALRITAEMGAGDESSEVITGSLRLRDFGAAYGRYTFRARIEPDVDQVTNGVIMLWPTDNAWPAGGMIEILETGTGDRLDSRSVVHWAEQTRQNSTAADHGLQGEPSSASDWHVYSLEWQPGEVTVSIDGGAPIVVSNDVRQVPQGLMDLAIRIRISPSPDSPETEPMLSAPVTMLVDWIRIERPEPGSLAPD